MHEGVPDNGKELFSRIAAGDEEAFTTLFHQHVQDDSQVHCYTFNTCLTQRLRRNT